MPQAGIGLQWMHHTCKLLLTTCHFGENGQLPLEIQYCGHLAANPQLPTERARESERDRQTGQLTLRDAKEERETVGEERKGGGGGRGRHGERLTRGEEGDEQ